MLGKVFFQKDQFHSSPSSCTINHASWMKWSQELKKGSRRWQRHLGSPGTSCRPPSSSPLNLMGQYFGDFHSLIYTTFSNYSTKQCSVHSSLSCMGSLRGHGSKTISATRINILSTNLGQVHPFRKGCFYSHSLERSLL